MASLTRKKDCKYWIACLTLPDGRRTNRSTRTTDRKLAQKFADAIEDSSKKAAQGQFVHAHARKVLNSILQMTGEDTLHGDTAEAFLREWLSGKVNEGTRERYTHVVNLFLAHLGRKSKALLSNISHKDIQDFIKSRESAGMASKTVRVDAKILNTAFHLAKRLGFIESNPVDKALALKPIKVISSERDTFTPEQVGRLVKAATGEWINVIMFGYFLGARMDDCVRMQWASVNFDKGAIDYVAGKTKVRAVVPMQPELLAHLENIASTDNPSPYISPTLATKQCGGKSGLSESFKRIMVTAGIDPKIVQGQGARKFSKLSFHGLRHSCNSLLANNGVDQETRMLLLGQKTKAINKDYTHFDWDKLTGAMAKLPSLKLNP